MLCMSKEHAHIFLLITFLIFNRLYEQKIKGYVEGVKDGVCSCIEKLLLMSEVLKVNSFMYYVL